MKRILLTMIVLVFAIGFGSAVQAKSPQVAIGLGAGAAPDYEGSEDYEGVPLLFVEAKWDNNMSISILGNKGKINLLPHPNFKAGLAMEYMGKRDDDVDNDSVALLPEVDGSFMLGGFVGFNYNRWNASLEAMADVSDGNDGSIVRLNCGYTMPVNNSLTANFGVFTTWADDDYMESYFTVTPAGTGLSGLSTYDAGSGLKDVGLNITVHYTPWQNWGIMGLISYKTLLNDAEDSPIVKDAGDDGQAVIGAILTYRF